MIWVESEKTFKEFNQFYLNPSWIVRIELVGNFCHKKSNDDIFYAPAHRTKPGTLMHDQVLAIYMKDETDPIYILGSEAEELTKFAL